MGYRALKRGQGCQKMVSIEIQDTSLYFEHSRPIPILSLFINYTDRTRVDSWTRSSLAVASFLSIYGSKESPSFTISWRISACPHTCIISMDKRWVLNSLNTSRPSLVSANPERVKNAPFSQYFTVFDQNYIHVYDTSNKYDIRNQHTKLSRSIRFSNYYSDFHFWFHTLRVLQAPLLVDIKKVGIIVWNTYRSTQFVVLIPDIVFIWGVIYGYIHGISTRKSMSVSKSNETFRICRPYLSKTF
jgi:hypothetical protein